MATQCVSIDEGKPIWVDVTFCSGCNKSDFKPEVNKHAPWFCPLWNEYMKGDDFCSKGA